MDFKELETKLKELGITAKYKKIYTEADAREFDRRHNIVLPDEYRDFLFKYGEVDFKKDISYTPMEGLAEFIVNFYGMNQNDFYLGDAIESYGGRMPSAIIPIAECADGNQICIGVEGDNHGKVYLWNHEQELEAFKMLNPEKKSPSIEEYWENISLISNTFYEFIFSFEISSNATSKEKLDNIEVWLDDDLFND